MASASASVSASVSASQFTYPGICYSKSELSKETKFEITENSVYILDPINDYQYTVPGCSAKYLITITDSGTKKRPYKNITIKKLFPICPLSGLPIIEQEMDHEHQCVQFTKGFAYNCYQVDQWQHYAFELYSTLYYKKNIRVKLDIADTECEIYLVVPILDGRHMQPDQKDSLMNSIGNIDVVNLISTYYNKLSANDTMFKFDMTDTPIKPDTLYHKSILVDLFKQNKLKLGIAVDDLIGQYGYMGSILILEPDAYENVSPYGKESYFKKLKLFNNCEQMMDFRKALIEKYFV